MPFVFSDNNRIINRWDAGTANFIEQVLNIAGAGSVTVTSDATGFTVSGTPVSSVSITAQDSNTTVYSGAAQLDFGFGFVVASGSGEANIAIDPNDIATIAVMLSGNQTIAGTKTFSSPILIASGVEPTTSGAAGTDGEVRYANDFGYLHVDGSWKRWSLNNF